MGCKYSHDLMRYPNCSPIKYQKKNASQVPSVLYMSKENTKPRKLSQEKLGFMPQQEPLFLMAVRCAEKIAPIRESGNQLLCPGRIWVGKLAAGVMLWGELTYTCPVTKFWLPMHIYIYIVMLCDVICTCMCVCEFAKRRKTLGLYLG